MQHSPSGASIETREETGDHATWTALVDRGRASGGPSPRAWRPASGSTMWRPRSAARGAMSDVVSPFGGIPAARRRALAAFACRSPSARRSAAGLRAGESLRRDRGAPRPGALDGLARGRRPTAAGAATGRGGPSAGATAAPAARSRQARPQSAAAPARRARSSTAAGRPSRSPGRLRHDHPDEPEMRVSPRDDLPVAVRAGPGRAAGRADALPAHAAGPGVARAGRAAAGGQIARHGPASASGRPRSRTGPCPATGRAT